MKEKEVKSLALLPNQKFYQLKNKPSATHGPIPKANKRVPTPTIPPKYQPILTTEISKKALTAATGKLVTFCKPIINPSLGPAPRLDTK